MTLLKEKQKIVFEKINEDYLSSGKTLEFCCNKNGISSRTYYNIRKKFGDNTTERKHSGSKTSKPKVSNSLFTAQTSKTKSPKMDLHSREYVKNMEIEFLGTDGTPLTKSRPKHSKKSNQNAEKMKILEKLRNQDREFNKSLR
jgi:hypothetical protein